MNWRRAPGIAWNTKDIACKGQNASNIIHDIAHYAVASLKERKHYDFGLGASPDTDYSFVDVDDDVWAKLRPLYNYQKCNKIETVASALGIYWEKELGLPWKGTAMYHAWGDLNELYKEWNSLEKLIKRFSKRR